MCFPNYAEAERSGKTPPTASTSLQSIASSHRNGGLSSVIVDPLTELNTIQTSLSALQRHYRNLKKQTVHMPTPEPALYQDALLESESLEAFFVGPTYAFTDLFNYFEVLLDVCFARRPRTYHPLGLNSQGYRSSGDMHVASIRTTLPHPSRTLISKDLVASLPP